MTTFEHTPARGADKIGPMRKGSNGIRSSMDIVFTLTLLRWEKKTLICVQLSRLVQQKQVKMEIS